MSHFQDMNALESKKYEDIYNDIKNGIEETRSEIEEQKSELAEAKKIRNNKMEYDALAKVKINLYV